MGNNIISSEIAVGLKTDLTCFEHTKEAITHRCGVKNSFSLMIKIARTLYANSCSAWYTSCKKTPTNTQKQNICILLICVRTNINNKPKRS